EDDDLEDDIPLGLLILLELLLDMLGAELLDIFGEELLPKLDDGLAELLVAGAWKDLLVLVELLCMRCGAELLLVFTVALLPLVFTRVLLLFLTVEFTLLCLALTFALLLKSERTLVEVLTAFPLDVVFPVARDVVARLSPFCLIPVLVVALPLVNAVLLLRTVTVSSLDTRLLVSNACLFFTEVFREANALDGLEFA